MDDSAGQENEEIGGAVRVAVRSQYSSELSSLRFSPRRPGPSVDETPDRCLDSDSSSAEILCKIMPAMGSLASLRTSLIRIVVALFRSRGDQAIESTDGDPNELARLSQVGLPGERKSPKGRRLPPRAKRAVLARERR